MRPSVIWTTLLLLLFVFLLPFSWATRIVLLIFSVSPLFIIHMVYDVLKNGKAPLHTFEERWYCDYRHE